MSLQRTFFDPPVEAVRTETRRVLRQVEENADNEWKEAALAAIYATCVGLSDFISDNVWIEGKLESTREDRALGPVFTQAKKLGWCIKSGALRPSKRSHMAGKPVWRSLIYKGNAR